MKLVKFITVLAFTWQIVCFADEQPKLSPAQNDARELLRHAVDYYKTNGEKAFAEFSHQGQFTTSENYVYVLDKDIRILASGGPSIIYTGRSISNLLGEQLTLEFKNALAQAPADIQHSQEYRWTNWRSGKKERKRVFYQVVNGNILAVGYYLSRSSPAEAEALLHDTASAIEENPGAALKRINSLDPFFNRDDLYSFVIDTRTEKMVAHGFNRRLINTDIKQLQAEEQPIGKEILSLMRDSQSGSLSYIWRNPITGHTEPKHTLLQKVGPYITAVGYYQNPH